MYRLILILIVFYVSLCSYFGLYKYKQARMHYQVPEPEVIDSCDHPEMDAGN